MHFTAFLEFRTRRPVADSSTVYMCTENFARVRLRKMGSWYRAARFAVGGLMESKLHRSFDTSKNERGQTVRYSIVASTLKPYGVCRIVACSVEPV